MAWDHLSITKPHLVYIILGGFTTLFMLCSSVIKERLYIGEATVATLCGIIFGPHAANLIDPASWGNVDLITLEFSRIVLVVQCFAVGVELPRSYMEKHWRSVVLLLIPVMTFGWLITSLFIWGLFSSHVNWLDSLCIAACVTATDPVLASSVVGKGKFAKRVPKHLRDLLSAESGCNDGMAFPFVYLAVYLIRYRPDATKVAYHWICYTILYECIFGAVYGVVVGYLARRAIRYAHERDLIDRESFLVFYFVLALWCAGSGSLLGLDDLLVGFACGVGFSNDGWFLEKTEESHVSNVIDLLINLAFFVYFGSIIPWGQFNEPDLIGLSPWRLVVLGLLVLFFRRIPIMLMLKPIIPDVKTWREASFAGHFGPIGVGGLFVAILARAELETESTTPLAVLPEEGFEHLNIIEMIWPITCFLVIVSIIVHGSSIAVFTLGKRINTLTISMSYTQANEDGPGWMDRLPRIQSRSRSSMGRRYSESSFDEKTETTGPGLLPPTAVTGGFLRRQKEEDDDTRPRSRGRGRWDSGRGPGGPISQSAIGPVRRDEEKAEIIPPEEDTDTFADTMAVSSDSSSSGKEKMKRREPEEEIYQEGHETIVEDKEGNVLGMRDSHNESAQERRGRDNEMARKLMKEKDVQHGVSQKEHEGKLEKAPGEIESAIEHPQKAWRKRMQSFAGHHHHDGDAEAKKPTKAQKPEQKRGPALAYQFGNTIIVEDEDGEVLKKYDIPSAPKKGKDGRPGAQRGQSMVETSSRAIQSLKRMGTHMGVPTTQAGPSDADGKKKKPTKNEEEDDDKLRFTVTAGGRRMSKLEFIQQMSQMNPKDRAKFVQSSDVPEAVKTAAYEDAKEHTDIQRRTAASQANVPPVVGEDGEAEIHKIESPAANDEGRATGPDGLTLVDSNNEDIPFHSVRGTLDSYSMGQQGETAAQRRRRLATEQSAPKQQEGSDEETPAERRRRLAALQGSSSPPASQNRRAISPKETQQVQSDEAFPGETAAERKRRLGALGVSGDETPETDSEDEETGDPLETGRGTHTRAGEPKQTIAPPRTPGIRFADQPRIPTKDERAAEDAKEKEERDGSKKSGLSKLIHRKK
jgi:NhaP-type Na+/H+ or K+/H+ antiporter